jgi:uncharacterized protein YlaI
MTEDSSNPKIIPLDYSCGLITREFKVTMMYEHQCWLGRDGVYKGNEDSTGVSVRNYRDVNGGLNGGLESYLMYGWPEAHQAARWSHRNQCVSVFADDLFLCPKCGAFRLVYLGFNPLDKLGLKIEGKRIQDWPTKTLVTEECAQRIRSFCQGRLTIKEFFFKECDDKKACKGVRQIAMRRLRNVWGWGKKERQTEIPPPPPDLLLPPKIETEKKAERLPWDEGHIYLIRITDHYKIGRAKDIKKRIAGIKTSSPFEIEILKSWHCKRPDIIEKIMHTRFGEHRVKGEWFRLPDEVVKYLVTVEDVRKEFAPDQLEGETD